MEYARIFILCLLCTACASEVRPDEVAAESSAYVEDIKKIPVREIDELDEQSTENPRDKRALGLLLSGLAQIFGYTVTPIQFASLPNPPASPAATSNSSKTANVKQQAASSRPANATAPRQQETIRFTGVLNFGNNSNIIGHLQRYEQIFHGPRNNTMTMPPVPSAKTAVDPGTDTTRPPLLAPFFVKIPLPIAPDLLPIVPLENLGLTPPPVRKEQEMIYRNNEDRERYTVEEKDIYDEKDVRKPVDRQNHQLYIDEPTYNRQQNDRRNELQREQEERVKKLKQQEKERNRDKAVHHDEEEVNERYKNREKEIAGRNRDQASKQESTEDRRPAHDDEEDEDSAERSKEYASQENLSNESSSKQSSKEQSEDYPSYEDDSNKPYKQAENLDKYVEVGYNQQLPIGDYYHEDSPEVIRDSYGEILDNKKLEDDRIAGYISMFKHPYQPDAYDLQRVHPEDASREGNEKETSVEDGYDEHLARLQKLREEYALPENKYEEYDLNDESEADRNDRKSERTQNRTSASSRGPKTGRDKGDRAKKPTGPNRDNVARSEDAKSQEVDYTRYMPLVVPVRYIDANDKVQQATTRQLSYKEADKSTDGRLGGDNAAPTRTVFKENLTPQVGLPERPRQLYEGEHKELHVWPPPFDYAFDNTQSVNTIVPPNPGNYYPRTYAPNYYQHVKEVATQDASDKSSEQPSGYLVVVGDPSYPYRYPYNVYYFPNEAVNSRDQAPHANAEVTRPRDEIRVAQQDAAAQQIVQARPNITQYNLNATTNGPVEYYYQEVPASVLDRYKYTFGERAEQVTEPFNIEVRSQIPSTENWSNRIYRPPGDAAEQPPRPVSVQLQNVASSSRNAPSGLPERPRHSRPLKRRKRQPEEQQEGDAKTSTTPQPIPTSKPFDDPQSAHDFFGFSKDDYNFGGESGDATKAAEENGKTAEESDVLVAAEPAAYHHDDESTVENGDEPETDTEKAKVREYRNKVATLRVSEQRQLTPNGPVHTVDFIRNL